MSERLLTTAEAAACLGVSRRRVNFLFHAGRLPGEVYQGRCGSVILFRTADVASFQRLPPGWPKGRARKRVGESS